MKQKYLIIVESPSKCSKIESYLGSEYKCIASKGHIRELTGLKYIDIRNNFEPTFTLVSEKKDHIKKMKEVISGFDKQNIFLATDDDREGEAISWHICQVFGLSVDSTKRILFREITKPAIISSLDHVSKINMPIVRAQHARQILDIIVGFMISPILWKKIYYSKTNALSAGRCQTPALRLIYENEKEKRDLETKYKTTGYFFSQNMPFELNHVFLQGSEIVDFLEKSKNHTHALTIMDPKTKERVPPKPFNTSSLLQSVSNSLHYSPKQTMQLCQNLYQGGYITYMRTENTKYAKPFLDQMKSYIPIEFGLTEYLGNLDALENNDKTNPHEAIRVTDFRRKDLPATSESKEASLYKLIWKNTMESCMSNYRYKQHSIQITAPSVGKKEGVYETTLEIPLFLGWTKVSPKKETDEAKLLFLNTAKKSNVPYSYIESIVTVQSRHSHYTESSLIQKLENLGIGRPSTFAMILDAVQDRGYVEKKDIPGDIVKCKEYKLRDQSIETIEKERVFGNEKNKLVIKPLGVLCIEFLLKHFQPLFEYHYTENLEKQLDAVASDSSVIWYSICDTCYADIQRLIDGIEQFDKTVFKIDDEHEVCFQKFGPVIRTKNEKGENVYEKINTELKLDLEKLKSGEYSYSELKNKNQDFILGLHLDKEVVLKHGKYGPYIQWNNKNVSVKEIYHADLSLDEVLPILEGNEETGRKPEIKKDIIRIINSDSSVRTGKYGPYIYYKTVAMKTPKFIPLKSFKGDVNRCDENTLIQWIHDSLKPSKRS